LEYTFNSLNACFPLNRYNKFDFSEEMSGINLHRRGIDTRATVPRDFWVEWQNHRQRLLRTCLRYVRGSMTDAEDLLGEAMIKAATAYSNRDSEVRDFGAWLYCITRNICVDHLRAKGRFGTFAVNSYDDCDPDCREIGAAEPSPEDTVIWRQSMKFVEQSISKLPTRLRMAIMLRFVAELDYSEIAIALDISPAGARKMVERARRLLRNHAQELRPANLTLSRRNPN
jgi:RNA polymerase sigma-70 factor (ECF subfamily)